MRTASRILFRSLLVVSSSFCVFTLLLLLSYPFGIVADTSETHLNKELLDWLTAGGLASMISGSLSLVVGLAQKVELYQLLSIGTIMLVGIMVLLFVVVIGTD